VSWRLDLKIILMTVPALLLQIVDARRGRKLRAQLKQLTAGIPGGEPESNESRKGLNQPRMEGKYSPEVTP
jgi:hypothetical protein